MFFRPQICFLAAGSVIGLSVLAVMCQPAIARQMDEWRLLPRPERVTELYFTDYRNIPGTDSFDLTQTVTFTVHNIEHRTTTYHYELTSQAEADNKEHLMAKGSFTLAHGHSLATTKNITPIASDARSTVKVNLEYEEIALGASKPTPQKQSIHYWFNGNKEKHEDS
jgi:hypothetical protein